MKSHIRSIGTANPDHKLSQREIAGFMQDALPLPEEEKTKLAALYRASGIESRYSVLEDFVKRKGAYTFFPNTADLEPFPTVADRMQLYKRHALPLALKAIDDCLAALPAGETGKVTHLVTVSCTGMYAPGLDIEIIESLGLRKSIQRTAINFMGCYGAFNGLKVADAICRADRDASVLVVCVELCSIHFQKRTDPDFLMSNALFADGAAALLVGPHPTEQKSLSLESFYCDIASSGKDDMAWHISDFGFEMRLSSYVPDMIKGGIGQLTRNLLAHTGLRLEDVSLYAIHPGGRRILEVIEQELGLSRADNRPAYETLKNYGNMSSPTVVFVLKSIFSQLSAADQGKNILSFAFGPGLTLESMLLKVHHV